MKTIDVIILSLCIGFFIIAIYETITLGITYSYWWFMVSIGLLLWLNFRRRSQDEQRADSPQNKNRKKRR